MVKMNSIEFDLYENAGDSLNEALAKYEQGKSGSIKSFKFCVQHFSQFFELILKYYVTLSHPLLIYKNPFAKKITDESYTIGLYEAINFLNNEGRSISTKFLNDLEWLKKLRNNIEHHKFSMDVSEVDETIGRLMSALVKFNESHDNINLDKFLTSVQYDLFHDLANTYEGRLKKAESKVDEYRDTLDPTDEFDPALIFTCDSCGHETIIPDDNSTSGYKCTFCGIEDSEFIEVECGRCGSTWQKSEMVYLDWADTGNPEYYCPVCMHRPDYVNDD